MILMASNLPNSQHEDVDTNKVFTEFFWDVFPEFQAVGQVTMFKVQYFA